MNEPMSFTRRQARGLFRPVVCTMCLLVMGVGCTTTPYRAGAVVDDEATREALRASMATRYPRQFRVVHRAVLTVRKRQFNLDGYILVDRSQGFRFLATSSFGTAMFELTGQEDGTVEVLHSSGMLSDSVLLNGPGMDVLALFLRLPSPSAQLTAPTPDTWALVDTHPGEEIEEYRFDRSTGRLNMYLRAKAGRVHYTIDYGGVDGTRDSGSPERIRLSNTKMRYTVDIRIIDLKPDEFDPKVLIESRAHD